MDTLQETQELKQVNKTFESKEIKALDAVEGMEESQNAAKSALDSHEIAAEHSLYARRYASEAAARATIGEDAVDLDEFSREHGLPFKGGNYPIYDISSENEVASVKTHWNIAGELDDNAINAYKRDFGKLFGWGRRSGALAEDARNILSVRDAGGPVPEKLKDASLQKAEQYLQDHSTLRIPDDHVDKVRKEIAKDIYTSPHSYHLPDYPSPEEVNEVLSRIKGLGLTSDELRTMIDRRMGH